MLYRITTQHKSATIETLCSIVSGQFKNFTLLYAHGYHQNLAELNVIFEIDSDCDVGLMRNVAADMKKANGQTDMILQVITNCVRYVI